MHLNDKVRSELNGIKSLNSNSPVFHLSSCTFKRIGLQCSNTKFSHQKLHFLRASFSVANRHL